MKASALLVVGFVCLAGVVFLGHAPAQVAAPVAKWEYKVVNRELDEAGLNKLGDDGWELAASTSWVTGGGGMIVRGASGSISTVHTTIKLTFKRPKR